MKIAIDYRPVIAAPNSGIARQALAIAQSLDNDPRYELLKFTALGHNHPDKQQFVAPPWEGRRFHRPDERIRFEQFFLPQALRDHRPDLYIATANSGLPWWGRAGSTRCVVLLHDIFQLTMPTRTGLKGKPYQWFDQVNIRQSLQAAHHIWTPSQYTIDSMQTLFPDAAQRAHVLYNRVSPLPLPSAATPALAALPERYWLLVGTREPRKNIGFWLEGWSLLLQERADVPDVVLVGHSADVPEKFRQHPKLHFISGITDEQLASVYQRASVLWHPSYAEGFGLPPLEALSLGTPVAVGKGSALDEVVPPWSERFDPYQSQDLLRAMRKVLDHTPVLDPAAAQQWLQKFTPHDHQARVHELVDLALKDPA